MFRWQDLLIHDGAFAVDSHQRVVYWGATAERLLGHRRADVMGKPCYEVVNGKDAQGYRVCRRNCPVMVNARRGRPTPDYDILCPGNGGGQRWFNVSVAVYKESRGNFQVLHLIRDVTGRRRTEEFARKAGTALRQLLEEGSGRAEEQSSTPLPRLSKREFEVLRLLAAGVSTQQIAETLDVRPVTARNHISRLLTKLGVENRLQAVVYASRHRLI